VVYAGSKADPLRQQGLKLFKATTQIAELPVFSNKKSRLSTPSLRIIDVG
jgi:hypothetical protein